MGYHILLPRIFSKSSALPCRICHCPVPPLRPATAPSRVFQGLTPLKSACNAFAFTAALSRSSFPKTAPSNRTQRLHVHRRRTGIESETIAPSSPTGSAQKRTRHPRPALLQLPENTAPVGITRPATRFYGRSAGGRIPTTFFVYPANALSASILHSESITETFRSDTAPRHFRSKGQERHRAYLV